MKDEIAAAVFFLTSMVKKTSDLRRDLIDAFQNNLTATLLDRFKDHWYDTIPSKGQGYRCIRINDNERVDPVLLEAAKKSNLNFHDLGLPTELTIWVDPLEVSCRLGENHGAFCTVALFYDGCSENKAKTVDIEKMLANHSERQQADYAKFVKATNARIKNRESPDGSRISPPNASNGGAVFAPGSHLVPPMGAYPPTGWDGSHPPRGYHGERFYPHGGYGSGADGSGMSWSNWEVSSAPHPSDGMARLSPVTNGNASVLCDPSNVHMNTSTSGSSGTTGGSKGGAGSSSGHSNGSSNSNNKHSRGGGGPITGGSHLSRQTNFSSHNSSKFRWVKPADAAQA